MPVATEQPKYRRLAEMLRSQIESGELNVGDRLPSLVRMHRDHGATKATMVRVYELLEKENLIERRGGSGVYVAEPRAQKSHIIGLLTLAGPDWNHPYYQRLVKGFVECAKEHHYETLLLNPESSIAWERMDAVVSKYGDIREFTNKLPPLMPFVSLMVPVEGKNSVLVDEGSGVRQLVQHLIDLQHQRIAILLPENTYSRQTRLHAYLAALADAEIAPDPQWQRDIDCDDTGGYSFSKSGYTTMKKWLQEGWDKTGCTALVTQNDDNAIGAIRALREHGLNVPDDVSVTGFDGTEIGLHVDPAITTVDIPLEQAGETAFRLLQQQMDAAEETIPQTVMLGTRLCERASTAAAPVEK
jgi:DNA-binding LacI/PurR family transcriptional regulator